MPDTPVPGTSRPSGEPTTARPDGAPGGREAEVAGACHVFLNPRYKCPKCGGRLQTDANSPATQRIVKCGGCGDKWAGLKELLVAIRLKRAQQGPAPEPKRKLTAADLRKMFEKGKTGFRALRNVAERFHISVGKVRKVVDEIKTFKGRESTSAIGDNLEGLMQQLILGLDDLDRGFKGEMREVPPVDIDLEPEPKRRQRRRRK